MLPPKAITGGRSLFHRHVRLIRPRANHQGSHPATDPRRGTLPHGPHHLRGLLPRETRCHSRRHRQIASDLPALLPHVVRVWFVVDATVDTQLLLHIAQQPLNKATVTSLGIQALLLWKALHSLLPYVQLHILKKESHRHQYESGKVDIQAVHQRTTHLPTLKVPDLDRNHKHLQDIYPKLEPHRTPDWVPEDAPYTSQDRAYHYPNLIQHLAHVLGDTDSRAHIQELQKKLKVPFHHSVLRPTCVPAHLQKRTNPAPQGTTDTPHHGRPLARPQAHPRPRRTHPLLMRRHHPGELGTLQDMPPPYRQGQFSALVPGGSPTAKQKLADPQPRKPRDRIALQGSPDQGGRYERCKRAGRRSPARPSWT